MLEVSIYVMVRRRSNIQSPTHRIRMWDAKMRGDIYPQILSRTKAFGLEKMSEYQVAYQHILDLVREILGARGVESHLQQEYIWYTLEIWRLTQRYKSTALQIMAEGTYLKYLYRGRDPVVLRELAKAMGVTLSSDDEIFKRLGATTAPQREVIAEGSITADGTEQVVMEYSGLAMVHGYIDLSQMTTGDEVIIRAYVVIRAGGAWRKYAEETFRDAQSLPALYVLPRLTVYGIRITLQQTAGTFKSFDYVFVKE